MKVQLNKQEFNNLAQQMRLRGEGAAQVFEMEFDVPVAQAQDDPSVPNEALCPEEQIKRNPALALDMPQPPTLEEIQAALLRWFKDPEQARGRVHYVPSGHPSGFGGHEIYIPRFSKSLYLHQRQVNACLTVKFDGKQWDASHVPGVAVGQNLWLRVNDEGTVAALYTDAQGNEFACKLTERNLD